MTSSLRSSTRSSPPSSPKAIAVRNHDRYFFDGGVVFVVEDVAFKVHEHHMSTYSTEFRRMFDSKAPPPGTCRLQSATDPFGIKLQGFTAAQFETLLSFFYEADLDVANDPYLWLDVLISADECNFDLLRDRAIREIDKLSIGPLERLSWGRQFNVEKWVFEAYVEFCSRSEPLSFHEGRELGLETVVLIGQARELVILTTRDVEEIVESIFAGRLLGRS
jgi:hypothetical protein